MRSPSEQPDQSDASDPAGEPGTAPEESPVYGVSSLEPVLFKAACPECRARFELPADAFLLAIGVSRRTTLYSFTCPRCEASVRKPAGERIVELLTGGGVRTLSLAPAPAPDAAPAPAPGSPAGTD
jgi:hypothetical protein